MRPPWPSMTRRASGSARPRPPRLSSNGSGVASYACCTVAARDTMTIAQLRPSRVSRRRSATTVAGPGFSRKNRSKDRVERRAQSRRRRRRSSRPTSEPRTRDARRDPCPPAQARPLLPIIAKTSTGCRPSAIAPLSSFPRSLNSATIATSRAHDFSASSTIRRCRSLSAGFRVALQHAQVAADDAGRRAEFVNGERHELRVDHWWSVAHVFCDSMRLPNLRKLVPRLSRSARADHTIDRSAPTRKQPFCWRLRRAWGCGGSASTAADATDPWHIA